MSDKLSDCPFCGNEAETEKIEEGCYGVGCGYCDFQLMSGNVGIGWHESEAAAIAAWNRRPSPAPAISESEPRLERSIEQWRKCDPDLMSRQSQAAIFYALKDAKHDILALDAARKGEKS